jgi:predicted nucleic acid-binding protein
MSAGRPARTFLDTNVLVYAEDRSNPAKQGKALELIKAHRVQRTGVVSLQVLQEYFVAATGKLHLDAEVARNKVEIYSRFDVAEPGVNDILAAIDLHRLHGFSFWDALILRMAQQTGCRVLLSEDMQDGRAIDGVRIVNPFL